MTDEELLSALRHWYERPFASESTACPDGPKFVNLLEWVRSGTVLSAGEAAHVQECSRCTRTVAAIRRELAGLAAADVESEPTASRLFVRPGRPARRAPFIGRPRPTALRIAGLAAAACVFIGLVLFWRHTGGGAALAQDLREVGFAPPLALAGLWLDPNDEVTYRDAKQAVAEAQLELAYALTIDRPDFPDPWIPWTKLYRNLMALGRWGEAVAEMQAFLSYAEQQDKLPSRYTMYYTALTELGEAYQAIGDCAAAADCYKQSLVVARDYQEWYFATGRSDDPRPHALARALAVTLAPRLWALSTLSAARRDQHTAWDYHHQAAELLSEFFEKECAFRGLAVAPGAPLVELCLAVVAHGDAGTESLTVKVREHLLREARLLRVDHDLDAAERALDLAATLPDHPLADESRLDFNEPMERLRIAIARGDFAAALDFAGEAARHTAGREFGQGRPSHAPIGPLARAELRFLRGVALAGLSPQDPNALTLIQSAINAVHHSAAALPHEQGKKLLERFTRWDPVVDRIRGEVLPQRETP